MNCSEARRAMLTADLPELRGEGDSPLALHVSTCGKCADSALYILAMTGILARRVEQATVPRRANVRTRAWPMWIALPLAAAIASVLLVRDGNHVAPSPAAAALHTVKQPVTRTVVNAPADRNVAVIEAANKITVVWDLGAKGGS